MGKSAGKSGRGIAGRLGAALAALLLHASASAFTLGFGTFPGPDGKLGTIDDVVDRGSNLDTQYSALGITFQQGATFFVGPFIQPPFEQFISSVRTAATFSIPVFGVGFDVRTAWTTTLTAFGSGGQVLATNRFEHPAGNNLVSATMTVASATPIASFTVEADQPNHIVNIDNLVVTTTAPVPEPHEGLMLVAGVAVVAAWTRRRGVNRRAARA